MARGAEEDSRPSCQIRTWWGGEGWEEGQGLFNERRSREEMSESCLGVSSEPCAGTHLVLLGLQPPEPDPKAGADRD